MNSKVQLRNKAIFLRQEGRSYGEIAEELKVSKGILSLWLKGMRLSQLHANDLSVRVKNKVARGRLNASISNRSKRISKEKNIIEQAKIDFDLFIKQPAFIIGLSLYWSRGDKKGNSISFMSSDTEILLFIKKWILEYLKIDENSIKYRLYTHSLNKNKNLEDLYWSKLLSISLDKFQKTIYSEPSRFSKNKDHKGSLKISIANIDVFRKILAWQKLLIKYYGSVVSV